MVGLHALQGMDEEASALKVIGLVLGGDSALHGATRPESMSHRAPRILGISPKIRSPILTDDKARCLPCKCQIHQTVLVDRRLDGVRGAFLVQGQSEVVGPKGIHIGVEEVVVERVRVPDMRGIAMNGKDLSVERAGSMEASVLSKSAYLTLRSHRLQWFPYATLL